MTRSIRGIILIFTAALLMLMGFTGIEIRTAGSEIMTPGREFDPGGSASLSGTFDIDDVTSTRIMGKYFGGPPTKLGEYIWTGDVNGDGIEDLAISCPYAPGALDVSTGGILYIWYGDIDFPLGSFDLQYDDPDIVIRGGHMDSKLLSSMEVGDLDGDGNLDIILGIESQPECGRIYVLWGSGSDWDSNIDLADIGVYEPNGNPFGFLNQGTYSVIGGYLRPVPLPFSDYKIGRSVAVDDLNNDGYDELIFSSPGWNNVSIVWGSGIRSNFGDNFTNIYDIDSGGSSGGSNGFGEVVKIADLDNNGEGDLIVGSSKMNNPEFSDNTAGSVMVYYNVKWINGSDTVDARDLARPIIWGDDPYDEFGDHIEIEDINNDGFDDILVGVPGDDGPSDIDPDLGAIMIFHGGAENKFPKEFIGEGRDDVVIYGANKKVGSEPGDRLGTMFSVGNFDGDNLKDLIVGISGADIENGYDAGVVSGYQGSKVFSKSSSPVDLGKISSRFTFMGLEQQYGLGFYTGSADLNNDGLDDIICSSPSYSGEDLERKGAGEAHVIMGSPIYIGPLVVKGAGYDGGNIIAGGHPVIFRFSAYHVTDAGELDEFTISLDPQGLNITFVITDNQITINNNDLSLVTLDANDTEIVKNGKSAILTLNLSFNWYFPVDDPFEIIFSTTSGTGHQVHRLFPDTVKVFRDISLSGQVVLKRNGMSVMSNSDWFGAGDMIEFSGPSAIYSSGSGLEVYPGISEVILSIEGEVVNRTTYTGNAWTLSHILPAGGSSVYTLNLQRLLSPPDLDWDIQYIPDTGSSLDVLINVDSGIPGSPTDLTLYPEASIASDYDDDMDWRADWTSAEYHEIDGNSTGIYGYQVTINDEDPYIALESGGMMGTYFFENDFTDPKITSMDSQVDFNWGDWGPASDIIQPYGFSVRWHGWFRAPKEASYRFSLYGIGEGKLLMDSEDMFDWINLQSNPITPEYELQAGEMIKIVVFFKQVGDEGSSVSLRLEDDKGVFIPIPSSYLHYPSNSTSFQLVETGAFQVSVNAVDWVGLTSDTISRTGFVDTSAPHVNLTGIPNWFDTTTPTIAFRCWDPNIGIYHGSGIDLLGVEYRLKREGSTQYSDWLISDVTVRRSTSGLTAPDLNDVSIIPSLTSNWTGTIQLKISDVVGNQYTTTQVKIGIDITPPEFDVVYPDIRPVLRENDLTFTVSIEDIGGSGVDSSTAKGRYRYPGGEWGEWNLLEESGINEEILLDFPMILPFGDSEIQFSAMDLVGNMGLSTNYTIKIMEPEINHPPIPMIRSPLNNSKTPEGHPVQFDATGTTDDGLGPLGYIEYHWYSDIDGYLGPGMIISHRLSIGFHNITLYVTDGGEGNNVSTKVRIEISEIEVIDGNETDPDGNESDSTLTLIILIALVGILIVATLAVFIFINHKRNEGDEAMIGYRTMSEDDYLYEKRIDEEERKMGIKVDSLEKSEEELEKERDELYGDIE